MLKTFVILEIFTFLSWLFGCVEKLRHKKAMVNFKIYNVINWTTKNLNTYCPISQEVEATRELNLVS